jgi:hypothetical protein
MIRTKLLSWLSILIYTCTFFLASLTVWIPPAQADQCVFIFFCTKTRSSFKSKGGVRRGPCAEEIASLTAFVPNGKLESTVEDYPTFWFYIPGKTAIKSAKFALLDDQKHLVQKPIYVQLPKAQNMIASLTLPNTGMALKRIPSGTIQ